MTESQSPPLEVQDPFAGRRRSLRIRSPKTLAVTLSILLLFVFVGVFGSFIAPEDPFKLDLVGRLQPPFFEADGSLDHPLGTDDLGRDTLSRLIHGAQISLFAIVMVIPGRHRGWLDAWSPGGMVRRLDQPRAHGPGRPATGDARHPDRGIPARHLAPQLDQRGHCACVRLVGHIRPPGPRRDARPQRAGVRDRRPDHRGQRPADHVAACLCRAWSTRSSSWRP